MTKADKRENIIMVRMDSIQRVLVKRPLKFVRLQASLLRLRKVCTQPFWTSGESNWVSCFKLIGWRFGQTTWSWWHRRWISFRFLLWMNSTFLLQTLPRSIVPLVSPKARDCWQLVDRFDIDAEALAYWSRMWSSFPIFDFSGWYERVFNIYVHVCTYL